MLLADGVAFAGAGSQTPQIDLLHASTLLRVISPLPSLRLRLIFGLGYIHAPTRTLVPKKANDNEDSNPRAHRTGRRDDGHPQRRVRQSCESLIFRLAPAFPAGINAAATWDLGLVKAHGKAIGSEHKNKGVNVVLGLMTNLGHNWEGESADPFLAGAVSAATINGYQAVGMIATVKHL
ncbi:glycosyl hydrolase family 3 N terminal domain-containing protein [Mycena epipterygia]|nr:glycosyl hydrolase family 3 N terminal domain-containing protein [Mycena epipterygia]